MMSVVPTPREPHFKLWTYPQLKSLADPEWLIDAILTVDSQVVLYGPSGDGKSFVALSMALAIATGHKWLGHNVKSGPVVYVAAEGGRGIRKRIAAWMKYHKVEDVGSAFFLLDAVQLRDKAERPKFLSAVLEIKPVLIVIDTFARSFVGGDENQAKDMGEWIEGSGLIQRETGATVMAIHHTVKRTSKGKPLSERGSGALRGAADTMIGCSRKDGRISLSCEKQKDDEEFKTISLEPEVVDLGVGESGKPMTSLVIATTTEKADVPVQALSASAQVALDVLKGLDVRVASTKQWREAIERDRAAPIPGRTFYNWVDELKAAGEVSSPTRGRYVTAASDSAIATVVPVVAMPKAA